MNSGVRGAGAPPLTDSPEVVCLKTKSCESGVVPRTIPVRML